MENEETSIMDEISSIKALSEEMLLENQLARTCAYGMLREAGLHGRDAAEIECEARSDARRIRTIEGCPYPASAEMRDIFPRLCYFSELTKIWQERGIL